MFGILMAILAIIIIATASVIGTLIYLDNRVTPEHKRLRIAAIETQKQNHYNDTYATFGGITYRRDGGDMPSAFTPVR